jgi:hypothetical protein
MPETFTRSELETLVAQALAAAGANPDMAGLTATALVDGEAIGQAGHGLSRVAQYAAFLRNGRADGAARPEIIAEKPAAVLIDAWHGLAYPALAMAEAEGERRARSQGVAFGRDLGISDESEARISENMARHGFPFEVGPFELGEVSFHLGWTFHKAGPNTGTQPRSVMTVIYMDAAMRLVPALSAIQANDRDQWCPGAREDEVIATRKNPVIWSH